jgi:thioredoxin 1
MGGSLQATILAPRSERPGSPRHCKDFINMASTAVHEFTDANFDADAMKADQPVLVDFWAEWCGPCRMLTPVIEELAGDFDGKARIGKLDVDSNREVATQFGIMSIPTVIILKNGEVAKKFVGLASKDDIAAAIDAAM